MYKTKFLRLSVIAVGLMASFAPQKSIAGYCMCELQEESIEQKWCVVNNQECTSNEDCASQCPNWSNYHICQSTTSPQNQCS